MCYAGTQISLFQIGLLQRAEHKTGETSILSFLPVHPMSVNGIYEWFFEVDVAPCQLHKSCELWRKSEAGNLQRSKPTR